MEDGLLDRPPRCEVFHDDEHKSFAPLRTVLPDHEDYARWGWLEAARSPDNGVVAHAYKLSGVGTLWVDDVGRIYRYQHPLGPRLLPEDRRTELLHELLRLMGPIPDALPRLIRLVPPSATATELQQPLEVELATRDCHGCLEEYGARTDEHRNPTNSR